MLTLSAIDQALDVALTGIMFGSITWVTCAFGTFVITRQRKRRASLKAAAAMPALAPASVSLLQLEPVSEPSVDYEPFSVFQLDQLPSQPVEMQQSLSQIFAEVVPIGEQPESPELEICEESAETLVNQPSIEITIEQPLLVTTEVEPVESAEPTITEPETKKSRVALPNSEVELPVIKPVRNSAKQSTKSPAKKSAKKSPAKPVAKKVKSAAKPLVKKRELQKTATQAIEIVCEPVNWKKWKVADLRKASIAKVCGVRTRPIGSKRNLLKADLIAQYEQQLKRMTQQPVSEAVIEDVA